MDNELLRSNAGHVTRLTLNRPDKANALSASLVEALINAVGKPCLYVKSFQSEHATEHDCIRQAFKRAK